MENKNTINLDVPDNFRTPIARVDNVFGDNIAYAERYDFSTANMNQTNRLLAITLCASVCYQSSKSFGSEALYNRLMAESQGLPSSSFESVAVLLSTSMVEECYNKLELFLVSNGRNKEYISKQVLNIEKYGSYVVDNNITYLLTNFRAIVYDFENYGIDLRDVFNTEKECKIINKFSTTFLFKIDMPTRSQMVRHRTFLQELCVSGETIIKTSQGKRKISEMYRIQEENKNVSNYKHPTVKSYNFLTKSFFQADVKEVFKTGEKEVFEISIQFGASGQTRKIKTSKDHKFLTKEGWVTLENVKIGEYLAINGIPMYHDKEWLTAQKEKFLKLRYGLKDMATFLDINRHTLKTWLKKFKLGYTPKEIASTYTVWNKGVTGKGSHSYGTIKTDATRQKISDKHVMKFGTTKQGFGRRIRSYWEADFRRKPILEKYNYQCAKCGSKDKPELDHIKPVYAYPELGLDKNNVQILCSNCHYIKSRIETGLAKTTLTYGLVVAIESVGIEETYDLEVDHKDHNYVANGIVVHNSRRYVSGKRVPVEHYISENMTKFTSSQSFKVITENTDNLDNDTTGIYMDSVPSFTSNEFKVDLTTKDVVAICMDHYYAALENGVKPQDARRIIPQTAYTSLWMGFQPFQLENFLKLRDDSHSQWEIQMIAKAMKELINGK